MFVVLFKKIVASFLIVPLNVIWLLLAAVLLFSKKPKIARILVIVSFAVLFLSSLPIVSQTLLSSWQNDQVVQKVDPSVQVIVVLGCGVSQNAVEFINLNPNLAGCALERAHYAAHLYERSGAPVLVSGGDPLNSNGTSEASVMQTVLEEQFLVPVSMVEDQSRDTKDNAKNSYKILNEKGLTKIYLVTHAWHMPRAIKSFEKIGFEIVPAPTRLRKVHWHISSFIPKLYALEDTGLFFRELIGYVWYSLI